MGLGFDQQQIKYGGLSTGLIKIGTDSDDPANLITANNTLTCNSATQILTTRVNFEVPNHNLSVAQAFVTIGFTPAAYNGSFVVDVVVDSDNVEVILLSDPSGNATVIGTYDDGTIDINFGGSYRITDRVNESGGAPVNNQFTIVRSKNLKWIAESNKDHTAFSEGSIILIADNTGSLSLIQLTSGASKLPIQSDTEPSLNTDCQIGNLTKAGGVIVSGTIETQQLVNDNPFNRIRNVVGVSGTINSLDNPITTAPISTTLGISTTKGRAFVADSGWEQTGGENPDQFTNTASSPTVILRVLRDNTIDSQALTLDVNNYESSPGVLTSIGSSKAANHFISAFGPFNSQTRGQQVFSGGSRLVDASNAGEDLDIPIIAIAGAKIDQYSINFAETDLDNAIKKTLQQYR